MEMQAAGWRRKAKLDDDFPYAKVLHCSVSHPARRAAMDDRENYSAIIGWAA